VKLLNKETGMKAQQQIEVDAKAIMRLAEYFKVLSSSAKLIGGKIFGYCSLNSNQKYFECFFH